jgi:hypothetical protein
LVADIAAERAPIILGTLPVLLCTTSTFSHACHARHACVLAKSTNNFARSTAQQSRMVDSANTQGIACTTSMASAKTQTRKSENKKIYLQGRTNNNATPLPATRAANPTTCGKGKAFGQNTIASLRCHHSKRAKGFRKERTTKKTPTHPPPPAPRPAGPETNQSRSNGEALFSDCCLMLWEGLSTGNVVQIVKASCRVETLFMNKKNTWQMSSGEAQAHAKKKHCQAPSKRPSRRKETGPHVCNLQPAPPTIVRRQPCPNPPLSV